MKREGFILLFVVILLAFLGIIALYSMERLRLATLIEENRVDAIRAEANRNTHLSYLLGEANRKTILSVLSDHLQGPNANTAKEYTVPLTTPSGKAESFRAKIDASKQEIHWQLGSAAASGISATQDIRTPFDDDLTLDRKMELIRERLHRAELPRVNTKQDLLITLSSNQRNWEIYELPKNEEPPTTEPVTDPADSETEPPETEAATEPPEGETEPDIDTTEEAVTEPPTTEPPITEPPTTESPPPAAPKRLLTVQMEQAVGIIAHGNITIQAPSQKFFYGVILLDGNLDLKRTVVRGIVLQRGLATGSNSSEIQGHYDSDHATNLNTVKYYPGLIRTLIAGLDLPEFIRIHTRGIYHPPPDQFSDSP